MPITQGRGPWVEGRGIIAVVRQDRHLPPTDAQGAILEVEAATDGRTRPAGAVALQLGEEESVLQKA